MFIVLCDTCSILMLWRIAPDMFKDERYKCVTTVEVHDEIFRTQKFKDKYPWRVEYRSKIKTLSPSISNNQNSKKYFEAIGALNDSGVISAKSGKCIELSLVDRKVLACALANGFRISTSERAMVLFAEQEFPTDFKGQMSSLEVINEWLEQKLISWDTDKQTILSEWREKNETPQPKSAISRFKKLTGFPYAGS